MSEAPTTYSGQRVDELLRCPICLDRFNQPKILPCQHTFCHSPCLQGLIDMRTRLLRCPECRAEHVVPYSGADGFPNNLIITNFLDLQPQSNTESTVPQGSRDACSICDKTSGISKCGHCDAYLCETCRKSHYTQLKFDVGRLVNQIRKGVPKLSEKMSEIEQKSEQIKQHVESVKSDMKDTIARYVQQLKDREKMLNSELETFLQGELRNLRLKQENVEVELASISSYCDSTEAMLNKAGEEAPDDSELKAIKVQCVEYKDYVLNVDTSINYETKMVKFDMERPNINSDITNYGSLTVTTPGQSTGTPRNANTNETRSRAAETNRDTRTNATRRSQWSNPVPLHELYTREVVTPPPSTPPTNRSVQRTVSDTRYVAPRARNQWRREPNTNSRQIHRQNRNDSSQFQASQAGNYYVQANNSTHRPRDLSNYMFRMGSEPHGRENYGIQYYPRINPNSILAIGNSPNPSPRRATLNSIFGSYTPEPEERPPPFNNQQEGNGNNQTLQRRNLESSVPGQSAAGENLPSTTVPDHDSRPAVAFSVEFDEGSSRRRGRRPARLSRDRNRTERGSEQNSEDRTNRGQVRRNSIQESEVPRGQNNSDIHNEPQPSTSSGPVEDSQNLPERPRRSGTFVVDEIENQNNNNQNETEEAETENTNDELPNEPVTDATTSNAPWTDESLTAAKSQNNYEKKGKIHKVIGGGRGNKPGSFTWPRGVASSAEGSKILVADSSNHRVQIFDLNGKFLKQIGSFGTAHGEFDCLAGVTCTEAGDIVTADRYNHRVQVFDSNGHLLKVYGREGISHGQLSYPWGIAVDKSKNVYVVDKENHRVQVFTWEGNFSKVISGFGEEPGRLKHPSYVAVSPDNRIIVSDTENHRIQVFSDTGEFLLGFGGEGDEEGKLRSPKGIAIDKQGFVLVADSGNSRIQVFRGNGQHFCMFGSYGRSKGQFKGLEGLAVTTNGKVVTSDKETHKIQVF